jgi:hypothetical protein
VEIILSHIKSMKEERLSFVSDLNMQHSHRPRTAPSIAVTPRNRSI